ncbi:MAG: hypothetical protein MRY21_07540 [Simkaniaceae bacterium]|nr:hypothetical protein [Simkaniaceae bacterium]
MSFSFEAHIGGLSLFYTLREAHCFVQEYPLSTLMDGYSAEIGSSKSAEMGAEAMLRAAMKSNLLVKGYLEKATAHARATGRAAAVHALESERSFLEARCPFHAHIIRGHEQLAIDEFHNQKPELWKGENLLLMSLERGFVLLPIFLTQFAKERDAKGRGALHYVAKFGASKTVIQVLLNAGARRDVLDHKQLTPLQLAKKYKNSALFKGVGLQPTPGSVPIIRP